MLENIPYHVAIIMDGNGRWAVERGLPRAEGHKAGVSNLESIIIAFRNQGVKYLTFYTFSTENWLRPEEEVRALIQLLADSLKANISSLVAEGIRLNHLGRRDRLPSDLIKTLDSTIKATNKNTNITVSIAFDYGGRDEIIYSIQQLASQGADLLNLSEEQISDNLFTNNIPDPDLIIRTGGDMRLSNFLIWQSAYSEFYATDTLWPDFNESIFINALYFNPEDVNKALEEYSHRERRFGKI